MGGGESGVQETSHDITLFHPLFFFRSIYRYPYQMHETPLPRSFAFVRMYSTSGGPNSPESGWKPFWFLLPSPLLVHKQLPPSSYPSFFYIFYKIYIWHILNWAVTISHLSRLLMTYILFHPFVSDQSDWILAHFLLKDRHQRERTWRTNCDYQGNRHGSRSYFDCFPPSDSKSPTRV